MTVISRSNLYNPLVHFCAVVYKNVHPVPSSSRGRWLRRLAGVAKREPKVYAHISMAVEQFTYFPAKNTSEINTVQKITIVVDRCTKLNIDEKEVSHVDYEWAVEYGAGE